jgi:hypothetical protein
MKNKIGWLVWGVVFLAFNAAIPNNWAMPHSVPHGEVNYQPVNKPIDEGLRVRIGISSGCLKLALMLGAAWVSRRGVLEFWPGGKG